MGKAIVQGKRGGARKKKGPGLRSELREDLIAIAFLAAGLFVVFCLWRAPASGKESLFGPVGFGVFHYSRLLLGQGQWLLAASLILLGLGRWFRATASGGWLYLAYGLVFVAFCGICHLRLPEAQRQLAAGLEGLGGGALGGLAVEASNRLIGSLGSWILYVVLIVGSLLVITGKTLREIARDAGDGAKGLARTAQSGLSRVSASHDERSRRERGIISSLSLPTDTALSQDAGRRDTPAAGEKRPGKKPAAGAAAGKAGKAGGAAASGGVGASSRAGGAGGAVAAGGAAPGGGSAGSGAGGVAGGAGSGAGGAAGAAGATGAGKAGKAGGAVAGGGVGASGGAGGVSEAAGGAALGERADNPVQALANREITCHIFGLNDETAESEGEGKTEAEGATDLLSGGGAADGAAVATGALSGAVAAVAAGLSSPGGGRPGGAGAPGQSQLPAYRLPGLSLLGLSPRLKSQRLNKDITDNVRILEETLGHFGVEATVTQVNRGPSVTLYEMQPAPGVKVSKIVNLSDDLALALAATHIRIEAPIPGKAAIGIEVPNAERAPVSLREVLEDPLFRHSQSKLAFALGRDIAGAAVVADLAKMPHLLIAGSTGSGKSVCMNALIASILFNASPDEVKLMMIDPKMVELSNYNGIPHLLYPVVTDPKKAAKALRWAVFEMDKRYEIFVQAGVKDITRYNQWLAAQAANSGGSAGAGGGNGEYRYGDGNRYGDDNRGKGHRQDRLPMPGQDRLPMSGQDRLPMPGQDRLPMSGQDRLAMSGQDRLPMPGQDRLPMSGQRRSSQPAAARPAWEQERAALEAGSPWATRHGLERPPVSEPDWPPRPAPPGTTLPAPAPAVAGAGESAAFATMPQVVILIDELADLMMTAPADVEDAICRLAQKARAAGMHLVVATQRPSVDVVTGMIKANIPSRIAFAVASQTDSRVVMDATGAEKLLGRGDMLFCGADQLKPIRVQGVFVSDKEIEALTDYLRAAGREPEYREDVLAEPEDEPEDEEGSLDSLAPAAALICIECGQASISLLQRKLRIGYHKAGRIIDQLETLGIVGGYEGSKARAVRMTMAQYEERFGKLAEKIKAKTKTE